MTEKKITPHEAGYRAFLLFGLTARNPFADDRQNADRWARGFTKARADSREGQAQ